MAMALHCTAARRWGAAEQSKGIAERSKAQQRRSGAKLGGGYVELCKGVAGQGKAKAGR